MSVTHTKERREELKEELTKVEAEIKGMAEIARESGKAFTPEQLEAFDQYTSQRDEINARLETLRRVESVSYPSANQSVTIHRSSNITDREKRLAVRAWCMRQTGFAHSVTGALAEAEKRVDLQRNADFHEGRLVLDRAQSIGTDSEGGYLKSGSIFQDLEVKLKAFGGMREVATVRKVPRGEDVHWATRDTTSQKSVIFLTENSGSPAVANTSVTYGQVPIKVYDWNTGIYPVSLRFLMQAEYPVEQDLEDVIVERQGRGENDKFTNGTGTNEPHGFLADATSALTSASPTAVTYNELTDLYHSVDPDYRKSPNCVFMMSDASLGILEKMVDENSRPLIWSANESLSSANAPTLKGKRIVINNDMPAMTAGLKAIAFGDFSKYRIADTLEIQIFPLRESLLKDYLAVGYIGYARSGGRLLQPAAIKVITQHA